MITIQITEEEFNKCKIFSEKCDTSHYVKRNQFNEEKRKKDSLIGKIGEIATFNYLKDKVENLTYPDFEIYSAKNKSWDFDLKAKDRNFHVKSQDVVQGDRFGVSWIFQYGNGFNQSYDKEIFDRLTDNQFISFVSINLETNEALIRAIVDLTFLHKKQLFKLPKLEKLQKANKLAVYLKDLERYPESLWM